MSNNDIHFEQRNLVLFKRTYESEELADVQRHMWESVNEYELPADEHGFNLGTFTFTVEFTPYEQEP